MKNIAIPSLIVSGLVLSEQQGVLRKHSPLGIVLLLSGLVWMMVDRYDEQLWFLVLATGLSYLSIYVRNRALKYSIYLLILGSWITYAGMDHHYRKLCAKKQQKLYSGVSLILLSTIFLLPMQRERGMVFDLGLPALAAGWFLLLN